MKLPVSSFIGAAMFLVACLGVLGLASPRAVAGPQVPSDGLIAFYPFDGLGTDASGHGHDGSPEKVVPAPNRFGQPGKAFRFDAAQLSKFTVPGDFMPTGHAPMTVSLWMRIEDPRLPAAGFSKYPVFAGIQDPATVWNFHLIFQANGVDFSAAVERFDFSGVVGGYGLWSLFPDYPTALQWHQVTLSFRGPTETALFLDGQRIVWPAPTPAATDRNPGVFCLGWSPGNGSFNGSLDDVRLYDRALSDAEALELFVADALPILTAQPTNVLASLGRTATLTVGARSDVGAPLSYQWMRDGVAMPGATNASLVLNNVQLANLGNYLAIVGDGFRQATSTVASVAVAEFHPDLWSNLIAHYPLLADTRDRGGSGLDLTAKNETTAPGRFGLPDTSYDFVPDNLSSLVSSNQFRFSPDTGMTVSLWFKYRARSDGWNAWEPLLEIRYPAATPGLVDLRIGVQKAPVVFYLDFPVGGTVSGMFQNYDGETFRFADGAWHHLAFSIRAKKMVAQLDGRTVHWQLLPGALFDFQDVGGLLTLGASLDGARFNGSLGDIRLYQRGFTEEELAALHDFEKVGGTDGDHDGLSDYLEYLVYHTDPLRADSDADGVGDGDEVAEGTDPLDAASGPKPRLVAPTLVTGKVGVPVSETSTTKYALADFAFQELPPGLTGDPSTGVIAGVPTRSGTNTAFVRLSNAWGTSTNPVTVAIARGTPTITWNPPASLPYGTVLLTSFYNQIASVPGSFLFDPAPGSVPEVGPAWTAFVTFTPDDRANYESVFATRRFAVVKAYQTITFEPPAAVVLGDAPLDLHATASSELPVQFQIVSGPGTLAGTTLTVRGGGTVIVRATQPGDGRYLPAAEVTRTIAVRLRLAVAEVLGGLVLREPDSSVLDYHQTVVLTAIPDDGYSFGGWTGDVAGSSNPLTFVITNNLTVVPRFIPRWTLAISSTPGGRVFTEPTPAAMTNGSHVVATAVPDDNFGFRGWKGSLDSRANPLEFDLNTNMVLTAEFARLITVSTVRSDGGSVSILPTQSTYLAGDVVTVVAAADEGYRFQDWKSPLAGLTNGSQVALTNDLAVEAVFRRLEQVRWTRTGEGQVTVEGGAYHAIDERVLVTAEPGEGWGFTGWSGSVTTNGNPVLVTVSTNTVLHATFKRWFPFTVLVSGAGLVEVSPSGDRHLDGTILSLLATPEPNWRFGTWMGAATGTNNSLAIVVTNDLTVQAVFAPTYGLLAAPTQDLKQGFRLLVEGETGGVYVLETSSGLLAWSPLTTLTNLTHPTEFLDRQARVIDRRFYRIRPQAR